MQSQSRGYGGDYGRDNGRDGYSARRAPRFSQHAARDGRDGRDWRDRERSPYRGHRHERSRSPRYSPYRRWNALHFLVVPGSYVGDLCSSVNCDFHCDLVVQSYSLSVLPLGDVLQSWFTKAIQVSLFLLFHLKLLRSWAHFCSVELWKWNFSCRGLLVLLYIVLILCGHVHRSNLMELYVQ